MRQTLSLCFLVLIVATNSSAQEAPILHHEVSRTGSFENFGFATANAGDVNGDGVPDFIVGAPGTDDVSNSVIGSAEIRSGKDGSLLHLLGNMAVNDLFGFSVATAGDVNGDGFSDVVIGAPGAISNGLKTGSATVYSGSTGAILFSVHGQAAGDRFGESVAGGHDLNGDGIPDWVVGAPMTTSILTGAPTTTGAIHAFSGLDGSVLFMVVGSNPGHQLGYSIAHLGDINSDGDGDLAIGAPAEGQTGTGECLVLSGFDASPIYRLMDPNGHDSFGRLVAGGGDYDGDGTPDLIVAAPLLTPGSNSSTEVVRVYSGSTGLDLGFRSNAPVASVGRTSVAFAADVDGDGRDDIIVGGKGGYDGSALIFSGLDDHQLYFHDGTPAEWANGTIPSMKGGHSVAGAGDVNGDGFGDVLVALPGGQIVRVLLGGPVHARSELTQFSTGSFPSIWLGPAGDFDQDGIEDAVVSDPVAGIRSGADGNMLLTFGTSSAATIEKLGDLNADGVHDYAVGVLSSNNGQTTYGSVSAYSGVDGSLIHALTSTSLFDGFGRVITALDDVDLDGIADYALGVDGGQNYLSTTGYAQVVSGATGLPLYALFGTQVGAAFGLAMLNVGDFDSDGHEDLAIAAPWETTAGVTTGNVYIYSTFLGTLIATIQRPVGVGSFGSSLAAIGDVDRDGVQDIAVGMSYYSPGLAIGGSVAIYSGSSMALLYQVHGDHFLSEFGSSIAALGDVDADGFPDFGVGARAQGRASTDDTGYGRVSVYSGYNGELISMHLGSTFASKFGTKIAPAGDLNGDGLPDIYVASSGALYGDPVFGFGYVFPRVDVVFSTKTAISSYRSTTGDTALNLGWEPNGGVQDAMTGTISCGGGSPGGVGLFAVSLARVDIPLVFGFPLLIASDPTNLLVTGFFGFDSMGHMRTENISRQSPYIAGSYLHIQCYELSPSFESSNALRSLILP